MPQRWSNATEHADGGNADFERRCLASILRISALYPTKRTNFFCSPGQIRIFQTLLETWLNDAIRDSALHLPNFRPRCRINRETMRRRRDVLLHQWKVVYRCNCVKEDVLFWVLFRARSLPHISPIIILTSCDWLLFIYLYKQLFLCLFLYSFVFS